MLILGLNEDLFDAGVTLCEDGKVIFAANEERYTRRKNEGGFPHLSLQAMLAYTGASLADIDSVYVAGHRTPPLPVRIIPRLHACLFDIKRKKGDTTSKRLLDRIVGASRLQGEAEAHQPSAIASRLLPRLTRGILRGLRADTRIEHVEHHLAHAAGAWGLSGYDRALCLTADGMGDGLSFTVSRCSIADGIQRLWCAPASSSLGLYFEALTEALGFVPCRDEGKLTGLAAHGDPHAIDRPNPFVWDNESLIFRGPYGRAAVRDFRALLTAGRTREDVCAWAQYLLEHTVLAVARRYLRTTGETHLVLAGGIFGNVKLNQRLQELNEVERIFVCPNMGDGGLGLGAVMLGNDVPARRLEHVFWGEGYSEGAMRDAVEARNLPYREEGDMPGAIAALLAEGRIVARFDGRMEWGPRALGNRSILADPSDRAVVERLNAALHRNDFMPFAPAMLGRAADVYLEASQAGADAARFMTTCFPCTPAMKERFPAVVHVDGTARAQCVHERENPAFHAILCACESMLGAGVVLNTSFNIHEEPIVRTPTEAVRAFETSGIDHLAIGNYIVSRADSPA